MLRKILIVIACTLSIGAYAEELTDEKRQMVDELLEVTGALKIGEAMGAATANQVIAIMAQQAGELDPKVVAIVQDEIINIMHDEFVANGWLNEMSQELYHQYLSLADLKALVAFYKTPVGARVVAVLPQISQQALLAGQTHGATLGPLIQQRLQARFEREGIQ